MKYNEPPAIIGFSRVKLQMSLSLWVHTSYCGQLLSSNMSYFYDKCWNCTIPDRLKPFNPDSDIAGRYFSMEQKLGNPKRFEGPAVRGPGRQAGIILPIK